MCESSRIAGTWLDLGAGDGRYTDYLLQKCRHVIATDIDRSALSKLHHRFAASSGTRLSTIVHNVVDPLPLGTETLDGVLCTGVLHYFPVQVFQAVVNHVHRVLTPGGLFIFDFSTDVERLCVDGSMPPVRRGAEYRYRQTHDLLDNFRDMFGIEVAEERVENQPMFLMGKRFIWNSRDLHVRCMKRRGWKPG